MFFCGREVDETQYNIPGEVSRLFCLALWPKYVVFTFHGNILWIIKTLILFVLFYLENKG